MSPEAAAPSPDAAGEALPVSVSGLAALCAASGLSLLGLLARLPLSAEFAVPRRPGWTLLERLLPSAHPAAARAAVAAASLLLAAALALMAWSSAKALDWRLCRQRLCSWRPAVALLAAAAALAWLARFTGALWFDLLFSVWFVPGSADLREPFMAFLGCSWVVFFLNGALVCLARWAARGRRVELRRCAAFAAAFAVPALALFAWASARCDVRARSLADAAGIPGRPFARERILVLGAPQGKADFALLTVDRGFAGLADLSDASLGQVEGYLARRPLSVLRQQAERFLWEAYSRRQDVARLREWLWASERGGDALAWLVLVDHLRAAPPDPLAAGLLDRLADEGRWRVGGRAARMLSLAYAHLGLAPQAEAWGRRAAGGLGVAAGLLARAPAGGALRPGEIRGVVKGLRAPRVALYARCESQEPYVLSPNRLVASAAADARGRFRFAGLAAGEYYLSLAVPADELPAGKEAVVLRGHRGDITLSPARPSAAVTLEVYTGARS